MVKKIIMKATPNQMNFFNDKVRKLNHGITNDIIVINIWGDKKIHNTISYCYESNRIGNYEYDLLDKDDSFEIKEFNPNLFLALIRISDKKYGQFGEWWKYISNTNPEFFTVNKLYKQIKPTTQDKSAFVDNKGEVNGYYPTNHKYFVKPTFDEIINFFSSQKQNIDEIKVGDLVIVVGENVRWVTKGNMEFNRPGFNEYFPERKIQKVFEIHGDYVYIDDIDYKCSNYIVVNKENIQLANTNQNKNTMENRILTPENAKRIIDIACNVWQSKLAKQWAENIVLNKEIEISEEFYKEMRKACTHEQHQLFDEIFGKDKKLTKMKDLKIGEAMLVQSSSLSSINDKIILRTYDGLVDIYDPRSTWDHNRLSDIEGIRVELNISHKIID